MTQEPESRKIGKTMAIIAWIIGIALMTQLFGAWEAHQFNPNQNPDSYSANNATHVRLEQNRWGHYLVNGYVNQKPASFMLDTGATDVVIPEALADFYQLERQGSGLGLTANGVVSLDKTTLNEISFGDIKLYNVRASITAGMDKDQPILLGMSVLKRLDLKQQDDVLTLTQKP